MRALAIKLALVPIALVAAYLAIAIALIKLQTPLENPGAEISSNLEFGLLENVDTFSVPRLVAFEGRDHTALAYRRYRSRLETQRKIYLLHDAGWHSTALHDLAQGLAFIGAGEIIVPDMRGHGTSPKRQGDIEYAGQLEDDLEDLIAATSRPGDKIIIGGYGFGGGLALRYGATRLPENIQGYFLLSPFLGLDNPINREDADPWVTAYSLRIAGLKLLNMVGLHFMDGETAVQLAFPLEFIRSKFGFTATENLSWRTFKSLDPSEIAEDAMKAIEAPILVAVAENDELYDIAAYREEFSAFSDAFEYTIVEGTNHISMVYSPKTLSIVQNWLSKLR